MALLDLIALAAAVVLLLSSVWLLQQCERLEVSIDSLLAIGLGMAAAASIGRAVAPTHIDPEHALILVIAAGWVLRAMTRRRRIEDRRKNRPHTRGAHSD